MADCDFGPKWTVNSDEAGAGFAIVVVVIVAAFVLAPAFMLGLFIGQLILDVKIFKYPVAIMCTVGYYYLLSFVFHADPRGALLLVFGMWLLVDYVGARGKIVDMGIVKIFVGVFKWLFSA